MYVHKLAFVSGYILGANKGQQCRQRHAVHGRFDERGAGDCTTRADCTFSQRTGTEAPWWIGLFPPVARSRNEIAAWRYHGVFRWWEKRIAFEIHGLLPFLSFVTMLQ